MLLRCHTKLETNIRYLESFVRRPLLNIRKQVLSEYSPQSGNSEDRRRLELVISETTQNGYLLHLLYDECELPL